MVPTSSGNHGKPGKFKKKFHALKNPGIRKNLNNYEKIMEFCEITSSQKPSWSTSMLIKYITVAVFSIYALRGEDVLKRGGWRQCIQ